MGNHERAEIGNRDLVALGKRLTGEFEYAVVNHGYMSLGNAGEHRNTIHEVRFSCHLSFASRLIVKQRTAVSASRSSTFVRLIRE